MEPRGVVGEIMSRSFVAVGPTDRVGQVVLKFVDNWVDGAPVVSDDGSLLGIITDGDLVQALARIGIGFISIGGDENAVENLSDAEDGLRARLTDLTDTSVSRLMTKNVITVTEETPISEAAQLMSENLIKRLPVVRRGRLVGMIARSDMVLAVLAQRAVHRYSVMSV